MLMNEKLHMYPAKFTSFQHKIVQMGALQNLQNSIQTLIILWPVYPIHTNSLFLVIFAQLPFCHFPPPNNCICGKILSNLVDLSFEYLSFSNKWKTTVLLPSPLTFLQLPITVVFLPSFGPGAPFEGFILSRHSDTLMGQCNMFNLFSFRVQ